MLLALIHSAVASAVPARSVTLNARLRCCLTFAR
jgi:hypothetical protein